MVFMSLRHGNHTILRFPNRYNSIQMNKFSLQHIQVNSLIEYLLKMVMCSVFAVHIWTFFTHHWSHETSGYLWRIKENPKYWITYSFFFFFSLLSVPFFKAVCILSSWQAWLLFHLLYSIFHNAACSLLVTSCLSVYSCLFVQLKSTRNAVPRL